jgi:ABC-type spermidine/putrescine transport system permease subunit II
MKAITFLIIPLMLLTGCSVSRTKVKNWNPNDYSRASTFYDCLLQAQQVESRADFGANRYCAAGSARTGAKTNYDILVACMNANGYQLRPITGGELIFTLITLPISIPFLFVGVGPDFY